MDAQQPELWPPTRSSRLRVPELVAEISNIPCLVVTSDRERAKEENTNIEEPTKLRLSLPQQLTTVTPQRQSTATAATASPSDLNNDLKTQKTDKTSTMNCTREQGDRSDRWQ